jgi:uncharacterized protein YndB with AHSA1/START domain
MKGAESTTIEVSRSVPAPVDQVWRVFTDLPARAGLMSTVDSVEMITGGFGVGTTWRETRTLRDVPVTEEWRVVSLSPPYRCVISSHGEGEDYQMEYEFTPRAGGTRIRVHFQATPQHPGLAERVLAFFVGGIAAFVAEGTLRQDLEDLAYAVEQAAA